MSLLPMWFLFGLSDVIRWLLFRVFGYRRRVVRENLKIAFPEKTQKEREKIRSGFEKNFTDTFIEMLKLFSASKEFLMKRVVGNYEVFNELYDRGLRCQGHMGHNFNWEMMNLTFGYYCKHPLLGVYMPLANKTMDRIFFEMRSRTGTKMLPATDMRNAMLPYRNEQYMLGLVADQVPGQVHRAWWLYFFGQPTPFTPGPEKGAVAGNIPVVFVRSVKIKRGYYRLIAELATDSPADLPHGELTRRYRDFLERVIRENPDMWLWSHRRWKRTWDPAFAENWIDKAPMPGE